MFPPAAATIEVREALAISGVSRSGRGPVPIDAVLDRLAAGSLAPKEGDALEGGKWTRVAADKDGWMPANGYLYAVVDLPAPATLSLRAEGDSLVYVNGVPRAGDVYATGYVHLPVRLGAGRNTLLFAAARGRMRASLAPIEKPLALDPADTTLPDAVEGDHDLLAGLVVTNAGDERRGLRMRVVLPDGRSRETALPTIPALSVRKVPVALPLPYSLSGTSLP